VSRTSRVPKLLDVQTDGLTDGQTCGRRERRCAFDAFDATDGRTGTVAHELLGLHSMVPFG
jgi:hypothetical protein